MSKLTWLTDVGSLGVINELDYVDLKVYAYDEIDGLERITYSKQLGKLPPGVIVTPRGELQGIPNIANNAGEFQFVYSFTVRATNSRGDTLDRTFSLTVRSLLSSRIVWLTPSGSIGDISENEYFEFSFDAYDTGGNGLKYEVISGDIGSGLQITHDGKLSGIPIVESATADVVAYEQKFTLRVKNPDGKVSDRTFSITVNRSLTLQIVPKNISLGDYLDGFYLDLNLYAVNISPTAPLIWTKIDGTLPEGVELGTDGSLTGYLFPFINAADQAALHWGNAKWDNIMWDSSDAMGQFKTYRFSVAVTDGARTDTASYTITVLPKSALTADNTNIWVDNNVITTDLNNIHNPFITTLPTDLPVQRQNSNFAFKVDGIDLDGDTIRFGLWTPGNADFDEANVIGEEGSYDRDGFDQQDQSLQGIFSVAMPIVNNVAYFDQGADDINPYTEEIGFDGTVLRHGDQVPVSFDDDNYRHLDPSGIRLDPITGWITGTLPPQTDVRKTYIFKVYCFKADEPEYYSKPVEFTLTILSDLNNVIDWDTPPHLGTINNGSVSEFNISASARVLNDDQSKKPLRYILLPGIANPNNISPAVTFIKYTPTAFQRLPQGLKLLSDGTITGRPTFQHFSIDGGTTNIDAGNSQFDNLYTFTVLATDATRFELDASTTIVDTDYTIFDALWTFDVEPGYIDQDGNQHYFNVRKRDTTVADFRTFTIRINNYNAAPYESLYVRALPSSFRRENFLSLIEDQRIFPSEYIYRPTDPWFGKASDIKFLFASGLTPTSIPGYIQSMQHNHYTTRIELGKIKTAVALDENFKPRYEVVYVEVVDPGLSNGKSAPDVITKSNSPKPGITTIYPNSLNNLKSEVTQIGFNNQEVMPKWMTSRQPDGKVLGMVRAVVLAYTVPGKSKLMAYRLEQARVDFSDLDFIVDRYQLDNYLSTNYSIADQAFIPSTETTFDRMPPVNGNHPFAGAVDFALTVPFDQINNRTVAYVMMHGGLDGTRTINPGQRLIFARQDFYELNHAQDKGYIKDPFDVGSFDSEGFNLDFTPDEFNSPNNGWNDNDGLYASEPWGSDAYDMSTIIPGYNERLLANAVNQQAGIWEVTIVDNIIKLQFVKEVFYNEYVQIASGDSFGGTKMYYDPVIKPGRVAPDYTILTDENRNSAQITRWEGGGTRFYDHRDEYVLPETGNKYLKFPKRQMYG